MSCHLSRQILVLGEGHLLRQRGELILVDERPFGEEYNHGTSAALKNAIDFLFHEWNNKAAGFIGYGGAGGVRAVENLRLVMGEIKIADVRAQVALSMFTDFENFTTFKPHEQHDKAVHSMADEVIAWGGV